MKTKTTNIDYSPGMGMWKRLLILLFLFFVFLLAASSVQGALAGTSLSQRTTLLIGSTLQNILAFILPAYIVARMASHRPGRYLGADQCSGKWMGEMLLLFILITPALNQIIYYNAEIHFPASMEGMEKVLRQWENDAAQITEVILDDSSIWGLISGVLVVGILTGIGEETFFRAGIQRTFSAGGMNGHAAVWITAAIFSAIHFQFFGFFPRLILGAFFGYMYLYSGSLWVSATAHALNNSIVVVSSWMAARGIADISPESTGVTETGFPWIAFASLVLTLVAILITRPMMKSKFTRRIS